jgi:hypothetical protein
MKIKLIAAAPYDGWAFIIKNERLYLLRPPYQADDLIESSEKDLAVAISKYNFQECHRSFDNFEEAINFLEEKYAEAMEKLGISLPDTESLKSLLEYAAEDILQDFLDKAEKELIPIRNLDAAESIALELLQLENVKRNQTLFKQAVDIIKRCQLERKELKRLTKKSHRFSQKYPNAIKKYTKNSIFESMNDIYTSRQLLPVGI